MNPFRLFTRFYCFRSVIRAVCLEKCGSVRKLLLLLRAAERRHISACSGNPICFADHRGGGASAKTSLKTTTVSLQVRNNSSVNPELPHSNSCDLPRVNTSLLERSESIMPPGVVPEYATISFFRISFRAREKISRSDISDENLLMTHPFLLSQAFAVPTVVDSPYVAGDI